jgi:Na+-translocating ferredoxin:NAD+ oxidoreductase RnfE subunit
VVSETKQTFVAAICTAAGDFIDSPILLKQLQICPLMATTSSSIESSALSLRQMTTATGGKVYLLRRINTLRVFADA